jgi:hypothetical protein
VAHCAEATLISASLLSVLGPARAEPADARPAGPDPRVHAALSRTLIWQRQPVERTGLTLLSATYDVTPRLALFARGGLVDDERDASGKVWAVANPAVGATLKVPIAAHVSCALTMGTTLAVGSGGGNRGSPRTLAAMLSGTDWGGPMFGPNHMDVFEGVGVSGDVGRLSLRVRSTLHPAFRVRGQEVDTLGALVLFTSSGASLSYRLGAASVFVELAETRFLNDPPFLEGDAASRQDRYAVVGARASLRRGRARLQPGLSYAWGIDAPKTLRRFHLVEAEVQVSY